MRLSDLEDTELSNRLAPARLSREGFGDFSIRRDSAANLVTAASADVDCPKAQVNRF